MAAEATRFCVDMFHNINPRWLVLLGPSGTGKTHLAKRVSNYYRRYLDSRLVPGQDLMQTAWRMRGGFASWRAIANSLREGDFSFMRDLQADWFLALDDIGAEYKSKTDFLTAKLDELIDARLGKWTVITANLSLAEISQFLDVRIASRLLRGGTQPIEVTAQDFNL